jgi:membrane protein YqaA with SNARE-associated domain
VLVALVGTAANLVIETINYGLYRDVLSHSALDRMRETRLARWALALFRRSPFLAVWIGTWSPIPDWTIRILGPMARYPLVRYLIAMGLGRAPRYWFFAELGRRVGVPKSWIVAALVFSLGIGVVAVWRARRQSSASRVAPSPLTS